MYLPGRLTLLILQLFRLTRYELLFPLPSLETVKKTHVLDSPKLESETTWKTSFIYTTDVSHRPLA